MIHMNVHIYKYIYMYVCVYNILYAADSWIDINKSRSR